MVHIVAVLLTLFPGFGLGYLLLGRIRQFAIHFLVCMFPICIFLVGLLYVLPLLLCWYGPYIGSTLGLECFTMRTAYGWKTLPMTLKKHLDKTGLPRHWDLLYSLFFLPWEFFLLPKTGHYFSPGIQRNCMRYFLNK